MRVLRERGFAGLFTSARRRLLPSVSYSQWLKAYDLVLQDDAVAARLAALVARPRVSVLLPVHDPDPAHLRAAIASVAAQSYPQWELCLCDDGSSRPDVRSILDEARARDPARVRFVRHARAQHISAATNAALVLARGEWLIPLDHDDVLAPHALLTLVEAAQAMPEAVLIYADEDKVDDAGHRFDPAFKPAWSPDLLRSCNYINHPTFLRADQVREIGGWRPGFEGSQDHDLLLRLTERLPEAAIVHVPLVLYHWRATPGSTALDLNGKPYAQAAARRAVAEHLARLGRPGDVHSLEGSPFQRVRHVVPEPPPLASILVPFRDKVELLARCVESIKARTTYGAWELILVDNGSQEARTSDFLQGVREDPRIRVLRVDEAFNYSRLNNLAAAEARGTVLVLLNNDTEVISPSWLEELVSHAMRPEVGCVGAKLLYADGRVQHAGVALGLCDLAAHPFRSERDPIGPMGYLSNLPRNVSAVTGACLAIRREVYLSLGGLDEAALPIAFNDVDLCLRARKRGLWTVYTPFAELYHHESASRGREDGETRRFRREAAILAERWHSLVADDPFYSPNLTRVREDGGLRAPGREPPPRLVPRRATMAVAGGVTGGR